MTDNELDLPFATHYCPDEGKDRGIALVFTTEAVSENDRCQCDVLCDLDADNEDNFGDRASELAEFVADALNAYVNTTKGLEHWRKVHPLMEQMRKAGRQ